MVAIPELRLRSVNDEAIRDDREYILYWMIANRRTRWNYSLEHAVSLAAALDKPLLVLEALRCGYEWASDRLHRFILQGMSDNAASLAGLPVRYYAYVEPDHGRGSGLLQRLSRTACAVVTDDFPCFFLPRMIQSAGRQLDVRLEAVDSNGLLPMRAADRVFSRAYDFRRWLQKNLAPHLSEAPKAAPFQGYRLPEGPAIPRDVLERWPEVSPDLLRGDREALRKLPIDHEVGPAAFDGGMTAAQQCLDRFIEDRLARYLDERNDPDAEASSGLSPYLHFGQISAHDIFHAIARHENWSPASLAEKATGSRTGWWGMSEPAESFLDELITWRELGYNMSSQQDDYREFDSLPDWARQTLDEHSDDRREHVYSLQELEAARTHDPLWNAAQRQLVQEGRLHNYMRMLWGKKVLEWTPSPQEAARILIELNNKYAVDGRDPNSYSGIFWVFGRYDRAWGPERPIYGKIRYMSSENTARKLKLDDYLQRYGSESEV